ncbi:MAG: radical SAM protein [Acidimicrobiales bacterium]
MQLRWELADGHRAQETLFHESIFEREPGRGEFRGMEFLHVRARRIINELKGEPFLPFRYTINAYRGCSHACSYCCSGDTLVLLADGRTKAIAGLQPGDRIYGTERRGPYRRYVPTTVLAHWSTMKPAYRVALDDGTELITSGDHRFLSDRGWKHVTGAEQGEARRPHLTTNNTLLGPGRFVESPKHTEEYQRGYLCGIIRGDGTVSAADDHLGDAWGAHHYCRLGLVDLEPLQRAREFLLGAGVETGSFVFQEAVGARNRIEAIRCQSRATVSAIRALLHWPSPPSDDWCKGFLAGIFDAEGSHTHLGILRITNSNAVTSEQVASCLRRFGFRFQLEVRSRPDEMVNIRLRGGLPEHLRFFLTADPATIRKRTFDGYAVKNGPPRRVVAVEPVGIDLPMYDITTGTGDFIANGVISHNCFARPTHTYLNLDADRDFERRIVVKVNAVERLRAELDPRRWAGDHIAMGTNTDPYQRCEGKYRLTQGIIEVLTEAANPFSILTKSTLVLRDLDRLVEAARRTEVRVNLSIGTLDDDVWKATEPGTPHPRRRLKAVEALNAAGIPCGVLMAPILPGLSDRPEQLREVAAACVDAGAVSVSTVLLHLRPGVKEVFLDRLGDTHPHLVSDYQRQYRNRSYLSKAEQGRVATIVHEEVVAAGGLPVMPRRARSLGGNRPPTDPHPGAEQLRLL